MIEVRLIIMASTICMDVKDEFSHCVLIGDKGYRSNPWKLTLFEYAGIELALHADRMSSFNTQCRRIISDSESVWK